MAQAGDPLIGRLLDRRYRIGSRIARGGMATVYEAIDVRLDRTVAVKVMHPGLGRDDLLAQRFVREAQAAAGLSHPNVVGVFDQGTDDDLVFLAMEFVPGHTLRDVIRKEAPMPAQRALELLEPIVSALAAAHRAHLIHRDVKPENVLIADAAHGGQIKIADFGLARAVSADTQHTATGGVLIGTVSYLAPELVIDGRSTARADVYAVGIVLFELLTGRKPHEGESPIQVAYRHVNADVPAPSSLVPGMPGYVDALVARATSRDPSLRPADAGVLLHQLHRVQNALREGASEDADLTADLAPRSLAAAPAEVTTAPHFNPERSAPPRPPVHVPSEPTLPIAAHRRSRKGPIILLLALSLAAAIAAGAWWFGWARYTSTPAVLGLGEAEAIARVEAAGLTAQVNDPAYSETVAQGEVLSSDPEPGGRVLDNGVVSLVMSLGPERYDVPRLAGRTEDEAQAALAATNLGVGDAVDRWSEEVPEGTVIATQPPAGTALRRDSLVSLVVSRGPRPRRVTDFTGQTLTRARAVLGRRGLEITVTDERYSDTVAKGRIIEQDPTTGTLFSGDEVEVVVSLGPELVEVPRVISYGVDAATEELEALGFRVVVREDPASIGVGFVFRTDPAAGTEVPKGSTVTIYLI